MAAALMVIVATTVVSFAPLNSAAAAGAGDAVTCAEGQVVKRDITKPKTDLKLTCPETFTFLPAPDSNAVKNVFLNQQGTSQDTLQNVCPGATGTMAEKVMTLSIPQLPHNTTTVYLQCQSPTKDQTPAKTCSFELVLTAAPPEGPQVCAVLGGSVSLGVKGEGGRTLFACGDGLTLSPKDLKKIYGGDCVKEEDLKDMTLALGADNYYALTATKKPSAKKFCYLCEKSPHTKGQGPENCAVLISTGAASGLAARSTFALALPCVLALLHFT